jgi:predicted transcriptional regulator with HTH domain
MSKSADDTELARKLKKVLNEVPQVYHDRSFSHIAAVAKALKKDPSNYLKELNSYYNTLNGAVSEIVNGILFIVRLFFSELWRVQQEH